MASLDHIGIAVAELPKLKELFAILGLEVKNTERVEDQKVDAHFIELPLEQGHLEFLSAYDPSSAIAQFIQKRGPGIHHLSFRVASGELDALLVKLKAKGYRLIYETPRMGAHSMRINFIHPSSAGGMLIEVMEPVVTVGEHPV